MKASSLFDSTESSAANSAKSSREGTPIPTTPRPTVLTPSSAIKNSFKYKRLPCWKRVLISNWFYYISTFTTFLLLLTLMHYHLKVEYCEKPNIIDCQPCPPNFVCHGTTKYCPSGKPVSGICVKPGTEEQVALKLKRNILPFLENFTTIQQIKEHELFRDQPTETLKIAVRLCGYTVTEDGRIILLFNESIEKTIVFVSFVVSMGFTLASFFVRHMAGL
ncbi:hypothetical protein TRFO_38136 [Tritrichomonas foetus]|uniref:Uncharacterized protein n=1 Tax=Tritrichomonas foetus TaxID=1144522 RepID=A0A1J4JER3_9EUKA|nr:hypothetical protein TRFO_38136 [Tritrichomonas foetus]|eukprot:OHS95748.1 hypothetical protein TRFO_38136 [Tritrichomonas foetus]